MDWWNTVAIATSSHGNSSVKFSNITTSYWKNLLLGIHQGWLKVEVKPSSVEAKLEAGDAKHKPEGAKRTRSFSLDQTEVFIIQHLFYK